MLSKLPIDFDKINPDQIDTELLRIGMIAELDAINLYEQLAAKAKDPAIRAMFLDIANEEKTHMGEFQAFLLKKDAEQGVELEKGKQEADEFMNES